VIYFLIVLKGSLIGNSYHQILHCHTLHTNTLAYYEYSKIMDVKSFITLGPGEKSVSSQWDLFSGLLSKRQRNKMRLKRRKAEKLRQDQKRKLEQPTEESRMIKVSILAFRSIGARSFRQLADLPTEASFFGEAVLFQCGRLR
jgi:hypothetical protein